MISAGVMVQYKKHASFLRQIFSDSKGHNLEYIRKMEHTLGDRVVVKSLKGYYVYPFDTPLEGKNIINEGETVIAHFKNGEQV